jgi:hypothetical protein
MFLINDSPLDKNANNPAVVCLAPFTRLPKHHTIRRVFTSRRAGKTFGCCIFDTTIDAQYRFKNTQAGPGSRHQHL